MKEILKSNGEMRYLPTESVMLAFGGSKSVESALLMSISRGGFCLPSVEGEKRIEGIVRHHRVGR